MAWSQDREAMPVRCTQSGAFVPGMSERDGRQVGDCSLGVGGTTEVDSGSGSKADEGLMADQG